MTAILEVPVILKSGQCAVLCHHAQDVIPPFASNKGIKKIHWFQIGNLEDYIESRADTDAQFDSEVLCFIGKMGVDVGKSQLPWKVSPH